MLDHYYAHCAIEASCRDLALAGLFLSKHGLRVNGRRLLGRTDAKRMNAVMLTCGTYDAAGEFAYRVGLPAKSGVGGGVLAVIPRHGTLCAWGPRLDAAGSGDGKIPRKTSKVSALLRAPGVVDPGRVDDAGTERPDPEVPESAKRRTFTAKYRLAILAEYDSAPEGTKGAFCAREGLCSSHIVEWRKARNAGALAGWAVPRRRKRRDRFFEQCQHRMRQATSAAPSSRSPKTVLWKPFACSASREHRRYGNAATRCSCCV